MNDYEFNFEGTDEERKCTVAFPGDLKITLPLEKAISLFGEGLTRCGAERQRIDTECSPSQEEG